LVHRHHLVLILSGGHKGFDLMDLVFADEVLNSGGWDHGFEGHGAALTIFRWYQLLREDAGEDFGELGSNLRLLQGRKYIDDAGNGRRCRIGVQGSEGEMAFFRGVQGFLNGREISKFADENNIGVLAD